MMDKISPLQRSQYLLLLLAIVLLWPAVVNGGAFYFPDTSAYIRGVDAAFGRAFGWHSVWTQTTLLAAPTGSTSGPVLPIETKPVLLGRSPFYGIIPFLGATLTSSDWPTILAQALLAGGVVIGVARHFIDPRQQTFNWACAACFLMLAATSLPFFVSMLMPDFMAGIGIIAAAALIAGWQKEGWAGRILWLTMGVAAALMHSANILILLGIALPALAVAAISRNRGLAYGSLLTITAALIGVAGEAAFATTVTQLTGTPPIRPPFVSARLIEDGPGLIYLDRTCPKSDLILCRFRSRMPQGSDTFLWSSNPRNGVFSAAPPADQRALSREQGRFVLAVVSTLPVESTIAMLRAAGRQMSLLSLVEFNYPRHADLERIPQILMTKIAKTRAYSHTMPVIPEPVLWSLACASLALIVAAFGSATTRSMAGYGIVAILGWCANDVICGVLSTPHDRYQTRIIWVLPLIGLLIVLGSRYARTALSTEDGTARGVVTPNTQHPTRRERP